MQSQGPPSDPRGTDAPAVHHSESPPASGHARQLTEEQPPVSAAPRPRYPPMRRACTGLPLPSPEPALPHASLAPSATPRDPHASVIAEFARLGMELARKLAEAGKVLARCHGKIGRQLAHDANAALASMQAATSAGHSVWVSRAFAGPKGSDGFLRDFVAKSAQDMLGALQVVDADGHAALRTVLQAPYRAAEVMRGQGDALALAYIAQITGAKIAGATVAEAPAGVSQAIEETRSAAKLLERVDTRVLCMLDARDLFRKTQMARMEMPPLKFPLISRQSIAKVVTSEEFGVSVRVPVLLVTLNEDGVALLLPQAPGGKYKFKLLQWYAFQDLYVIKSATQSLSVKLAVEGGARLPPGWVPQEQGKWELEGGVIIGTPPPHRLKKLREIVFQSETEKEGFVSHLINPKVVAENEYKLPYSMIGELLEDVLSYENSFMFCTQLVPLLVHKALHHLIGNGLAKHRLIMTDASDKVAQLRRQACRGILDLQPNQSVDEVAELLKCFLRELLLPVIPPDVQDMFHKIQFSTDQQKAIVAAFEQLRPACRTLLRELLSFFSIVVDNQHINYINAQCLASVVAPLIARPSEKGDFSTVVATMIGMYWDLFEAPQAPLAPFYSPIDFVGLRRKLLGHDKAIRVMSLSPDNKEMWSLDSGGETRVWDTKRCNLVKTFSTEVKMPSACCTAGKSIWVGSLTGVYVFDPETKAVTSVIPSITVLSLTYVACRDEVWCGMDGTIMMFKASGGVDLTDGVVIEAPEEEGSRITFFAICVASTNCVWAGGHRKGVSMQMVHVYDLVGGKYECVMKLPSHPKKITSIKAIGEQMWMTSDDCTISAWDSNTYVRLRTMEAHMGSVFWLSPLPDQVWSCSWDKTIRIWDTESFECLGVIRGYHTDTVSHLVSCVDEANSVWNIWSASFDKSLCVWSVRPLPSQTQKNAQGPADSATTK
eukprot:m51a1_g2644 putative domain-containing protein (943) ;mRNA; f:604298-607625